MKLGINVFDIKRDDIFLVLKQHVYIARHHFTLIFKGQLFTGYNLYVYTIKIKKPD